VSRRDDERVADILDAADEIAAIIEFGRDAWDKDRIRQLAVERLLEIHRRDCDLPQAAAPEHAAAATTAICRRTDRLRAERSHAAVRTPIVNSVGERPLLQEDYIDKRRDTI